MTAPHPEPRPTPEGETPEARGLHDRFGFLAHHFDEPAQQYEAGKLGIWLFLLTEILFFSGLFVAYGIYRNLHPEVFHWAHFFLDTKLGAINTVVLIVSSLTAAWSVRSAQLGQRRQLLASIAVTMLCASTFMGIKAVEYRHKVHTGLLPGDRFAPTEQVWETPRFQHKHPAAAAAAARLQEEGLRTAKAQAVSKAPAKAERAPFSELTEAEALPLLQAGVYGAAAEASPLPSRPRGAQAFFGLYFFMTGLHGLHVLIGIVLWGWVWLRARNNDFSAYNFGAVDGVALYWHLVDLIWIFLFPLLYLIH